MVDHIRPVTASVVALATETKWGQVLQTPHAYGVVEVYVPDGVARVRGVQLLTKLTHAFDAAPVSLAALTAIADEVMSDDIVSLVLLVPVGSTIYLVSRGRGCVYLKRENKLAKLLENADSLSGSVRPEDTIIAATNGFTRTLTQEEIIGVFDHLTPTEVAEKLTIRLHERNTDEGGAAALIFQAVEEVVTDPQNEDIREAITHAPKISRTILLTRAKAIGRRFMTVNQRMKVRRIVTTMRARNMLSRRHLLVYTIVGLFIISVILGIRRQILSNTKTAVSEILVEAQHSFDEGMALLELNPVKGRERLAAARDLLDPVIAKKLRSEEGKKAKELYDEVAKNLTRAMRVTKVTPELYFDMSLLKSGAKATDLSLFNEVIGVLDAQGKTAFTLGAVSKKSDIVGGGENFSGSTQIAAYGDKLYVWTPQGIHQIRLSDQKTVATIIPASDEWGSIADMAAFGGNIYLLDTGKSRIWKYVAAEQGFSTLFEYLNPDTLPDLSRATSMSIDGSVWLGTATGNILRFTAGKENSYTPQGADTALGSLLMVYTDDEAKLVYVLDPERHRVVVFDKDGLYISQYVWEASFSPTKIVASESTKKLFLLAEGKIYTIPLQ